MSKTKRILFLIAIMCTNFIIMGESALIPIYYMYYEMFPTNMTIANTLVSGPQLIIIIASLAATALMKKFSKKSIMIAGAIIFAVSGIGAVISTSAVYMITMRMLFGVGNSLVNVTAVAVIADEYEDEMVRGKIMGIYNAVMAAVGAVMSTCAGFLAVSDWKNTFHIFFLTIPVIILLIVFIPKADKKAEAAEVSGGKKEPYGLVFWITIINFFLYNVCYAFMMFLSSSYVTENALGNEAYIGIVGSVGTVGSFLYCLAFGPMFEKMKKNYIVINYAMTIVCMALLFFFPNPTALLVISFLFGCTYGSALSYAYTYTSMVIPKSRIDDSIGLIVAVFSLACFLSTYLYTFIMQIFGMARVTDTLPFGVAIAAVITIIEILLGMKLKKQKA